MENNKKTDVVTGFSKEPKYQYMELSPWALCEVFKCCYTVQSFRRHLVEFCGECWIWSFFCQL